MADHLARTRRYLADAGVDGLLLFKPENRRYATGFTGSAGLACVTAGDALLAVDFRYYEQAAAQAPACEVLRAGTDVVAALAEAVRSRGARRVGFESEFVPFAHVERWRGKFAASELVPLGDVDRLRWVKDDAEIAAIQRAAELSDAAIRAHAHRAPARHHRALGRGRAGDVSAARGRGAPVVRDGVRERTAVGAPARPGHRPRARRGGFCDDGLRPGDRGVHRGLHADRRAGPARRPAARDLRPGARGAAGGAGRGAGRCLVPARSTSPRGA